MTDDRNRIDNNDASRDEDRNRTDDERGIGLNTGGSSSRTGDRRGDDDMSDIGGTDEMDSSTGGLAGTSR